MKRRKSGFDLRNDILFKKALGSPGQESYIAHFLRDVAGIPAKSAVFLPTENHSAPQMADVKKERHIGMTRVDLLVQLEDGTQVTIEMQRKEQRHFAERMLLYMGKGFASNYSDKADARNKYASLLPVYGINIVEYNFHTEPSQTSPVTRYRLLSEKNHQPFVSRATGQELLMVCIFELQKVNETSPRILQYWQTLFFDERLLPAEAPQYLHDIAGMLDYEKMGLEEREMIIKSNKDRDTYYEELNTAIWMGEEKGKVEGEAKGKIEGEAEGKEKKAKEIAAESLKNGASIEFTAKITGLSRYEVQKIAEKLE